MKNYKTDQNRYKYKTKISMIRQKAMENYNTMHDYEALEKQMVEKLKTTFMEVNKTEAEIRALEKGKAKKSPTIHRRVNITAKLDPLISRTLINGKLLLSSSLDHSEGSNKDIEIQK